MSLQLHPRHGNFSEEILWRIEVFDDCIVIDGRKFLRGLELEKIFERVGFLLTSAVSLLA